MGCIDNAAKNSTIGVFTLTMGMRTATACRVDLEIGEPEIAFERTLRYAHILDILVRYGDFPYGPRALANGDARVSDYVPAKVEANTCNDHHY